MMRFSIRDLLWVTVTVSLVVGWVVERQRLKVQIEQLKEEVSMREMVARVIADDFGRAIGRSTLPYRIEVIDENGKRLSWELKAD